MKKVVLMNMPSTIRVYGESALKGIIAPRPLVSLAELAGAVLAIGSNCKILDLQVSNKPFQDIEKMLKDYKPDFVGLTFTTLLFHEAKKVAKFIKEKSPETIVITGGVHSTIYPEEVIAEDAIDIVVRNEGDITLQEIVNGKQLKNIKGIYYKTKKVRHWYICRTLRLKLAKTSELCSFSNPVANFGNGYKIINVFYYVLTFS